MSTTASAEDLADLRDAVRQVCSRYGHEYYVATSESGGNARELWSDLGAIGALGVAIPEEFGGGGQGAEALAVVAE